MEQAKQDAKELLKASEKQAITEKQQQLQKAKEEAEKTAQTLAHQAREQAVVLKEQAKARQQDAVREILRVVLS